MSSTDALVFPSWKWIWNFLGGSLACLLLQKRQMAPWWSQRSWDCPGGCLLALFYPLQATPGSNTCHPGCGAHQSLFPITPMLEEALTQSIAWALLSPLSLWDERDGENGYKVLGCSKRKGRKNWLKPITKAHHFQQQGERKEFGLVTMKSPGAVIWNRHWLLMPNLRWTDVLHIMWLGLVTKQICYGSGGNYQMSNTQATDYLQPVPNVRAFTSVVSWTKVHIKKLI